MSPENIEASEGEISPEALQQLNELLDEGPGEDATEEEVADFMKKFTETEGGAAMLKGLTEQLAEGGGDLLSGLLGQEVPMVEDGFGHALYEPPKNSLRLVFHLQAVASELSYWRRITLPADACFFDLHSALQDAFELRDESPHRIEWREGQKVAATFLSGDYEVKEGDDYCEYQNRPLDLFSEGVTGLFYCQADSSNPSYLITMEKLIDPNSFDSPVGVAPICIGGEGPGEDFKLSQIVFRTSRTVGGGNTGGL